MGCSSDFPQSLWEDQEAEVIVEWAMTDSTGRLLWEQTAGGVKRVAAGTFLNRAKLNRTALQQAVDAVFRRLQDLIVSAPELRTLATSPLWVASRVGARLHFWHVIKGAIKIIAPMTYRERYHQSTGRDPLRCPHCQGEMTVWRMWHPKYGVIYDEAKRIRQGDYERRRERTPTDLDGQVARRALA